jgi:hypothetical protein
MLAAVALGLYAVWRVRGPGRLRYGTPELYVDPELPFTRTERDADRDFIRSLQLPDSTDGLKPRARPAPVEAVPAGNHAHEPTPVSRVQMQSGGPPPPYQNGHGDPTLQLLPGRLEVVAGMDGDSIRFIKQPGVTQEVTLGRSRGEPGSHVQVPSPTVSRMHVRMKFEGGRWTLENLSETNPVSINGRPATGRGAQCVLSDGDRIELGEVAFFFRNR